MFKLEPAMYDALLKEFQGDKIVKEEAKQIAIGKIRREDVPAPAEKPAAAPKRPEAFEQEEILIKNTGSFAQPEKPKAVEEKPEALKGPKVVGKIDLDELNTKTRPDRKSVV